MSRLIGRLPKVGIRPVIDGPGTRSERVARSSNHGDGADCCQVDY
jgi:hypothetical protein